MVTNKRQAILLSVMCLWFATAFIISCYHPVTEEIELAALKRARFLEERYKQPETEWKFHFPHERRYHEDLTRFTLLVLPVFAICVPLWFIWRDSSPVSPAASSRSPRPPDGPHSSTV